MSLPKIKVLTIDIWGTTLASSKNRSPLQYACKVAKINFEKLNNAMNKDKYQNNENKVEYFERIFNRLGIKDVLPAEFVVFYQKQLRLMYLPNFKNRSIRNYLRILKKKGIHIAFLSNTGYLDSYTLQEVVFLDIPVFGSDILGVAKPSLDFYKKALLNSSCAPNPENWLHFGNDVELDINPVKELGGNTMLYTKPEDWVTLFNTLMAQ